MYREVVYYVVNKTMLKRTKSYNYGSFLSVFVAKRGELCNNIRDGEVV